MLKTATSSARRFVRDQRWAHMAAGGMLRGCPDRPPDLVTDFDAGPVLVIAPHMDDEAIGCGGTIIRHRAAGAAVTVVYMTDGARGNPQMRRDESLIARRKGEAREAARLLGGPDLVFLDQPERELSGNGRAAALIARQLDRVDPAVVYLPWALDGHPDHIATCRAASRALVRVAGAGPGPGPRVREYEVWSPLTANCLVDITAQLDTKLEALGRFTSQLTDMDYVHVARGLGMYRSLFHLHGRGAAEAFFECSVAGQAALLRRLPR